MKRILILTLTLAMLLVFTVPSFASEGTDISLEAGEEVSVLPPEETALPETPEAPEDLDIPENPDTSAPTESQETPEVLVNPENPNVPIGPEDPAASEDPAIPTEDLIDVLVPATGQMMVNPYGIQVELDGSYTTDQIVHRAQTLTNLSEFPVTVDVTVIGTLPTDSTAYFVPTPPQPDTWDKEIFMYVEFQTDSSWWSGVYNDWSNQVQVLDWGASKETVLTLDAFSEGYFRLFGTIAANPTIPWETEDEITVTIVFTFSPVVSPIQAPLWGEGKTDMENNPVAEEPTVEVTDLEEVAPPNDTPEEGVSDIGEPEGSLPVEITPSLVDELP